MQIIEDRSDDRLWVQAAHFEHEHHQTAEVEVEHDYNASNCLVTIKRPQGNQYFSWDTDPKANAVAELDTLIELLQRLRKTIEGTEV